MMIGCKSMPIKETSQMWPTGEVFRERKFVIPEQFGNFEFSIVRRIGSREPITDMTYFRVEHVGPKRLIMTALWVTVDGVVYGVSPAPALHQSIERGVDRTSKRYYLRQINGFIFTENLLNVIANSKESVIFTVIGEKQHFGANVYEGAVLLQLQESLRELGKDN